MCRRKTKRKRPTKKEPGFHKLPAVDCVFVYVCLLFPLLVQERVKSKHTYTSTHTHILFHLFHPFPFSSLCLVFLLPWAAACRLSPPLTDKHPSADIHTYTHTQRDTIQKWMYHLAFYLSPSQAFCRGRKEGGTTKKKEGAGINRRTRRLVVCC